jgi:hypothetical protein
MARSELVGYVRKSNAGHALKICVLKEAILNSKTVDGKDGTAYYEFIINLEKIKLIIGDEHEVTSLCMLTEDEVKT